MKLNHLIIIGALCGALLIPSSAQTWGVVGLSSGAGGGGAVCSETADETLQATCGAVYTVFASTCGQKLDINSTQTVCKVTLKLRSVTQEQLCHIEFWPTIDMTGSKIGGDSSSAAGPTEAAGEVDFTWSANYPELTGDCYMHIVKEAAGTVRVYRCANTVYVDTDYDAFFSGADADVDLWFKVYLME